MTTERPVQRECSIKKGRYTYHFRYDEDLCQKDGVWLDKVTYGNSKKEYNVHELKFADAPFAEAEKILL